MTNDRAADTDKALKRVLNHVNPGLVLCIEMQEEKIVSSLYLNGINVPVLPHLLMMAYAKNIGSVMTEMEKEKPQ